MIEQRWRIAGAVFARVAVYGAMAAAVILYAVGYQSFLPRDRGKVGTRETLSTVSNNLHAWSPTPREKRDDITDWPHLRGLHYDAQSAETGLADSWPAEGPPVLWIKEIGQGYSGAIGVGGIIYTQTQTLTEQKAIALDADTGETIWEHHYGWPYDPGGMYPGPRGTPTWSDGKLYIAAPDGLIVCLNAADGREIWSVNAAEEFKGRGTDFGYSCSPLVEDGKVILPVGGPFASVVALSVATGATVWKSGSTAASYCSALPISFAGRRQVVVFLQNELAGFDLKSGLLTWARSYSTGYDEHAAMPLYDEPYLRTMQPFRGGSDLFRLEELTLGASSSVPAEEKSDILDCRLKLLRTDKQMSNDVASSVLVEGYVYGFDLHEIQSRRQRPSRGKFRCMDFKTGQVRWSNETFGQATIAVADKKLYLFNDRGEAILARVDPERCVELSRAEVFRGEICWTAPSLHRGRLYLRSPTKLACLYVGKPENLGVSAREQAKPVSAIPKERRLELDWLVGAERDAAFDLPNGRELAVWYWFSALAVCASAALAGAVFGALQLCKVESARCSADAAFYVGLIIIGIAATPIGNRVSSEFVFTWPVALFAVHQIALRCIYRAKESEGGKSWRGVLGAMLLVFLCLLYYDFSRRLSLGAAWYFLPTFLAAWPLAVPAARRAVRRASLWGDMVWFMGAFTVYFWASAVVMMWRTAGGS